MTTPPEPALDLAILVRHARARRAELLAKNRVSANRAKCFERGDYKTWNRGLNAWAGAATRREAVEAELDAMLIGGTK